VTPTLPAGRARLALFGAVIVALAVLCAPARAAAPAGLDQRIAALSTKVIADPLDAAAVQQLTALRAEQAKERREGLDALVNGLEAYLAKDYGKAATHLAKAAAASGVADIANVALLTSLDDVLKDCRTRRPSASATASRPKVCPICGGSGEADCPKCSGAGWLLCKACKGKGTTKQVRNFGTRSSTYNAPCTRCTGRGEFQCPTCGGKGVVDCKCKGKQPDATAPSGPAALQSNAAEAIRKTIEMAKHLRDGGLDLYSPRAFEPSPKPKP